MGIAESDNGSTGHNRSEGSRSRKSRTSAANGSSSGSKRSPVTALVAKPLTFTIASEDAAIRGVQKTILDDVERHGYNGHNLFAIKLALEEALINAIKHGNKYDPKKKVHVEAKVSDKQTEVTVEDEGPGFTRDAVPDPTLEENIEKCSGRGILLMEAYMNSVSWSNGGRRVKFVKKNEDDVLPRQ